MYVPLLAPPGFGFRSLFCFFGVPASELSPASCVAQADAKGVPWVTVHPL